MRKFVMGLVLGAVLGSLGGAVAATLTGPNGFLNGWTVTRGSEVLCQSPFVFATKAQIDCH